MDSLTYDDAAPWPTAADGQGYTLELKNSALDNSLAASWGASLNIGGTPGKANSVATKVSDKPSAVQKFVLQQNYPNPFNAETIIKYQLPRKSSVRIKIFNLSGQEIATLVNEEKASGSYQIRWNGNDNFGRSVASGVYVLCLQAGNFLQVRKMVAIR